MCDASQNLRFHRGGLGANHRGGLGRLFDESQSPRFCANGLCFSLLRKTGPKLARPTRYSAKRGQNRGPNLIAHRFWLLENWLLWHGGGKNPFSPCISNAWFQTVLSIGRFTEDQRKACGQLTTTARRQRAKSRGNAQVARTRARHASRAARRKDTQKVRETFTRAPVPTPHPSRLHGPRPG